MDEMLALEPEVAGKIIKDAIDVIVAKRKELKTVAGSNYSSRELSLGLTKIEEAEMWLFKALDIVERDLKEVQ